MKRCSELIGIPVVKTDGQFTSYLIDSIIYSKRGLKIIALSLQPRSKVTKGQKSMKVIQYKKIKELKEDQVVIDCEKYIIHANQVYEIEEALKEAQKIIGFEVYSAEDELVGVVKDAIFDMKTGKLTAFVLSEGIISDLARGYSILPLNNCIDLREKNIILNEEQKNNIITQEGGLKKLLGIDQRN